jgi:hypothetical protein
MLAQISGDNIIRKKDWKVFENFESCFLPLRDKNRTFLTPFLNNCWVQNSLSLQLSLSVTPQLSQALMQYKSVFHTLSSSISTLIMQ